MEENLKLYQDIALRTDGDIYVGVVGPVRTGKSTFIKKLYGLTCYSKTLITRIQKRKSS